MVLGQRHHSHHASVRLASGFGLCQAPPLGVSVLPTTGLPTMTGAVVTDSGVPRVCAWAVPPPTANSSAAATPAARYRLLVLITEATYRLLRPSYPCSTHGASDALGNKSSTRPDTRLTLCSAGSCTIAMAAYLTTPRLPGVSGTVVMKFGGTSVADAERIKRAARRIVSAREQGHRVVAVLSARGKTTDELISMAEEVSTSPDAREMDMLLSTGERISCALCAMAINDLGQRAISLTGSQAGIVTDTSHTKARILDVRADRIRDALDQDLIVLVAGFQGVSTARDVTTLGRGGSDTTAVALAAAIDAEVCEIYTDVAGVFTADPRIVPDARKLSVVSFEEMLEMSASGAGVLQLRSVEYARNHGVRIHCRSSFTEAPGTFVVGEEETMERPLITAVTHSRDEARITLLGVPDHPGVAGRIFTALAEANVNVDMIIQDEPREGAEAHMSFTVPRSDLRAARAAIDPVASEVGISDVHDDPEMGKVSVVGAGMKSHPGVAAKVFATLGDQGINIEMISTSPIKISCVVTADSVDRAVRALHEAFELGADQIEAEHPFGAPA